MKLDRKVMAALAAALVCAAPSAVRAAEASDAAAYEEFETERPSEAEDGAPVEADAFEDVEAAEAVEAAEDVEGESDDRDGLDEGAAAWATVEAACADAFAAEIESGEAVAGAIWDDGEEGGEGGESGEADAEAARDAEDADAADAVEAEEGEGARGDEAADDSSEEPRERQAEDDAPEAADDDGSGRAERSEIADAEAVADEAEEADEAEAREARIGANPETGGGARAEAGEAAPEAAPRGWIWDGDPQEYENDELAVVEEGRDSKMFTWCALKRWMPRYVEFPETGVAADAVGWTLGGTPLEDGLDLFSLGVDEIEIEPTFEEGFAPPATPKLRVSFDDDMYADDGTKREWIVVRRDGWKLVRNLSWSDERWTP